MERESKRMNYSGGEKHKERERTRARESKNVAIRNVYCHKKHKEWKSERNENEREQNN